jgi:hypothetical protein
MPLGHRAKAADEPEMMDMDEPVALEPPVELVAELDVADEEEEEAEQEETITIRSSDLIAL